MTMAAQDQPSAISLTGVPKPVPEPGHGWSATRIASPETEPIDHEILNNPAASIGHLILRRATATPNTDAYKFRNHDDQWESITWSQFSNRINTLAAGMLAIGLEKGQAAAIIAGTSLSWVEADISLMSIGVQSIAIYPTSVEEDLHHILHDSESRIAIVEDRSQVEKLLGIQTELPNLDHVYVIDPQFDVESLRQAASRSKSAIEVSEWVSPISELYAVGEEYCAADALAVRRAIDAVDHDTIACLQYTSGTTGQPKGAVITHGAWVKNVASAISIGAIYDDDLHFIWLPMAHLFGRYLVYLTADAGITTAIDGRIDKIVENLQELSPTVMGGAPRIFEKAYSAIMAQFEGDGIKAKLGKVSIGLALEDTKRRLRGERSSTWHRTKLAVADKVVLSKIRAAVGGRIRLFISGSAPINKDITTWFTAMGMPIAEGYGLTEGCITHLTRLGAFRIGTIGWPLPGVEARIADDGELKIRSEWNLLEYHNQPEATKEVLPGDGFLYTGDIAREEDGFYYITDRKKALFKTSNGKYVAPAAIESEFKGLCPIAMELATYGEGHKYIVGMVVLEEKAARQWCATNGIEADSIAEISQHPKVVEFVQQCLSQLNSRHNTWEQVKRFRILDRELTIDNDELTASLKMRRKHVHKTMEAKFESMYTDPLADGVFNTTGATWISFEQPALKEHPVLDDSHDIHLHRHHQR